MDLISVSPHWSMYSLCSVKFFSPPHSSDTVLYLHYVQSLMPENGLVKHSLLYWYYMLRVAEERRVMVIFILLLLAQISPFQTRTSVRNCKLMTSQWVRFLYECAPFSFLTQHKWECYLLHLMYRHTHTHTEMDFVPVSLTSWPAQLIKRCNFFWTHSGFISIFIYIYIVWAWHEHLICFNKLPYFYIFGPYVI